MVGKNVEISKLPPGKFDNLVGNFVIFNEEIHQNIVGNCIQCLPGKNSFFFRPAYKFGDRSINCSSYPQPFQAFMDMYCQIQICC